VDEGFTVFPIHPGFVTPDMGLAAAEEFDTGFMVALTPSQSGEAVFEGEHCVGGR
jgi:hypothetical protein